MAMTDVDRYLLGRSHAEVERLRKQALELESEACWLLDRLNIRPGSRAIDLGCGPCGILGLLSERVGPEGTVVGLERSEQFAAMARQFVADHDLGNVEVLQGDAMKTGLPRESFDLAHARLVMVNVPQPERFIEEMVALVKPGGMVASPRPTISPICVILRRPRGTACPPSIRPIPVTTGSTSSSAGKHNGCSAAPESATSR
jgi:tRNA A58 N-methylase Trm61